MHNGVDLQEGSSGMILQLVMSALDYGAVRQEFD
jgi:hypothetical protein